MVRPTALALAPFLCLFLLPGSCAGQSPDSSGWKATATVLVVPAFAFYNGRVNVQHAGIIEGPRYKEETDFTVGLQVGGSWITEHMGPMGISGFVAAGKSTGTYLGIASGESKTRDIFTLGLDVAWRPSLGGGAWGSLDLPFGPSLMWQRLELSAGHRNAYGDPDGLDAPDVDWSDRTWLSWGGFGGMSLTLNLTGRLGIIADATARFTFPNTGSWSGQEQEDINASTGNVVLLNYEAPVIFFWTGRAGLSWRP